MSTSYYFDPETILLHKDKTCLVKECNVGDSLMDCNGSLYNIVKKEVTTLPGVKITPFRATPFYIPLDGTLHCKSGGVSIYAYGEVVNIEYKMIEHKSWISSRFKLYRSPAPFTKKECKIHPYIVGCWFVRGNRTFIQLKSKEVIEEIQRLCGETPDLSCSAEDFTFDGTRYNYRFNKPFYKWLQEMKMEKSIANCPTDYLYGDTSQRIALLTGILDSIGHLRNHCSTYDISLRRKDHAESIAWVARTLGFYVNMKVLKLKNSGRLKKTIPYKGEPVIRIFITIDPNIVACVDPKKRAPVRTCQQTNFVTGFEHEFNGDYEFVCLTVDSDKPTSWLTTESIHIASTLHSTE